jgi:hypothetical protein
MKDKKIGNYAEHARPWGLIRIDVLATPRPVPRCKTAISVLVKIVDSEGSSLWRSRLNESKCSGQPRSLVPTKAV